MKNKIEYVINFYRKILFIDSFCWPTVFGPKTAAPFFPDPKADCEIVKVQMHCQRQWAAQPRRGAVAVLTCAHRRVHALTGWERWAHSCLPYYVARNKHLQFLLQFLGCNAVVAQLRDICKWKKSNQSVVFYCPTTYFYFTIENKFIFYSYSLLWLIFLTILWFCLYALIRIKKIRIIYIAILKYNKNAKKHYLCIRFI